MSEESTTVQAVDTGLHVLEPSGKYIGAQTQLCPRTPVIPDSKIEKLSTIDESSSCHITAIHKDLQITCKKILCECNEVPGILLEAEGTVLICASNMQLVTLCRGSTPRLSLISKSNHQTGLKRSSVQ